MNGAICGHEREPLRWALKTKAQLETGNIPIVNRLILSGRVGVISRFTQSSSVGFTNRFVPLTTDEDFSEYPSRYVALCAIGKPDKLAEIIAELLRSCTSTEAVVIAPNFAVHYNEPSRLDYVVYWDRDHGGTIQIKPPCGPNDPDTSKLLTMQQARAFALKLLDDPVNINIEQAIDAL